MSYSSENSHNVSVIGAGAAGLMAAYRAALRGNKVTVFDPNQKQGRKLRITGKGRCNVCNACDVKTIMANIPGDGRFLFSALNAFGPERVMDFFESKGVKLKIERGNRVFPESDNANDIADLLVKLCTNAGVRFIRKTVKTLDELPEGSIIIATGGMSYPLTGSTGAGYAFARSLGHTIIPPKPSLIPLESDDEFCRELQGFAPKNVMLRAYEDDKLIYRELGEMLFTHFGVSGPLVLSASAHMRDFPNHSYRLEIDLKPGLDEEKLEARILRDFSENANKQFINYLPKLTGSSLAPVICRLTGIPETMPVNSVTREQRAKLRAVLKAFPVHITGTRPIDEAIITAGGVKTSEINPRTMESKLAPGVFFCGEVLNLDAYTGGFNLQIAWSTGFLAGEHA